MMMAKKAPQPPQEACCSNSACCGPQSGLAAPPGYPSRESSIRAWEALTEEIAIAGYERSSDPPPTPPKNPGSLTILGSGIESIGFSRDAEAVIQAADKVFYCVADSATIIWLKRLRPDAHDLYVFYEDDKVRFKTYVQMTEAMLHPVRQGQNVVAIYYGHPGIFVLSTHRAVQIARREGHHARMKPGISALDCLCADLGVDPAHPGLLTFEATDMLVRRRRPAPTLHVVLWQVGLVGQMGYRRKGFINDKLMILVEYLQEIYGEDYPVTHYVAARYPTLEPTTDVYKLSELGDPAIQQKITGLSTFYLAPRDATPSDSEMAARIGLVKPGQKVNPAAPSRPIADYGPRELAAIEELEGFRVPSRYQDQAWTRAGEFLIRLTEDPKFARLYWLHPERAVSEECFPGLSEKEKRALIGRNDGPIQIAVKGSRVGHSESDRLVVALLSSSRLSRELQRAMRNGREQGRLAEAFAEWTVAHGFDVRPREIPSAVRGIGATMLLAWTGAYYDPRSGLLLGILGHARTDKALVFCNGDRLRKLTYHNAALSWHEDDGNPHSGLLRFDLAAPRHGPRVVQGVLQSDAMGQVDFVGTELDPSVLDSPAPEPAATFEGEYETVGLDWSTCMIRQLRLADDRLELGRETVRDFGFENGILRWHDERLGDLSHGRLQFLYDAILGARYFFGTLGADSEVAGKKSNLCGHTALDQEPSWAGNGGGSLAAPALGGLVNLSREALRERLVPFWSEWWKSRFTSQIVHRTLISTAKSATRARSI